MRYRTIVADPPWEYEQFPPSRTGSRAWRLPSPYPMMTVAEIAALPVAGRAERDCRLFLWATSRYLGDAFDVMRAWGFAYKQALVWRKTGNVVPLRAHIAPVHAEFLLVGTVGSPAARDGFPSSVIDAPKGAHSVKPEAFLDAMEAASPGPYLEMFARRQRLGWDTWGNEALPHVELAS